MPEHVIIDGNNLLFAMGDHAAGATIGRETLVRIIERWASGNNHRITLVFDGPVPPAGMSRQMASRRLTVRFSAPVTADDVIVDMIHAAADPADLRIVSSDSAIRYEARLRRCRETKCATFVGELYAEPAPPTPDRPAPEEKPTGPSPGETEDWLDRFGVARDDDEPFDGHEAMRPF